MAQNVSDQQIRDYYINQTFIDESPSTGHKTIRKGVSVNIHPDLSLTQ